jgi:hypothetical protein
MQEIYDELLLVINLWTDLVENSAQWLQKNQGQMVPTFGATSERFLQESNGDLASDLAHRRFSPPRVIVVRVGLKPIPPLTPEDSI